MGMPIGIGREGYHSGRLSGVFALGLRLHEGEGQGTGHSARKHAARLDDGRSR